MKQILVLIFLIGIFLYLFNTYNPFGIKIFGDDSSYIKKEIVVKAPHKKAQITSQVYFDRGEQNLKDNNFKVAISNYSKAIELNHKYYEAYRQRALAKDKIGDFSSAQQDYEKYMMLLEEINQKQYKAIYSTIEKLVNEGYKKLNNNEYTEALDDFYKIIETYPHYPDGYIARADTYFALNNYKLALKDYKMALDLGNKTLMLYLKLADTNYELADYENAIQYYNSVLNLNSNYEKAYYKLVGAYIFIEDFEKAYNNLSKYIESSTQKTIKIKDFNKWNAILDKYTTTERIRDLKHILKSLKLEN